jgi:hypothetical protein
MSQTLLFAKVVALVTVVAVVLAFSPDPVSSGQFGGIKVFLISGKNNSISTSTSSSGRTGGCDKAVYMVVTAAISGGDADNTVTATASCDAAPVVAIQATDPGRHG